MAIHRILPALIVLAVVLSAFLPKIFFSQSTSTIEGVVLEGGTDRPLQYVRVSLSPGTNAAYSDAEGRFRIDFKLGRKRLLDTMLASTLKVNGVSSLLTLDRNDFTLFESFTFPK